MLVTIFATLETRRGLEPKCVAQKSAKLTRLSLSSLLSGELRIK